MKLPGHFDSAFVSRSRMACMPQLHFPSFCSLYILLCFSQILTVVTFEIFTNASPLPLGWCGWAEAFCSYISGDQWIWPPKGSTKSVFLQSPSKLYMPYFYKMTVPNPIFSSHFHHRSPRAPSTK